MSRNLVQSYLFWKAKNKDPESFAKVYDLYIDKIYRFVYFKVSDPELAQDLAAETFLKTWEYINEGKKIENLNALIYRIARNLVIDHYRRKSHSDLALEDEVLEVHSEKITVSADETVIEKIDIKIEIKRLEDLLLQLKDEYREILVLRHMEEMSISEIADVLEKKQGAVRVTLHRAQKALESLSEKEANA